MVCEKILPLSADVTLSANGVFADAIPFKISRGHPGWSSGAGGAYSNGRCRWRGHGEEAM